MEIVRRIYADKYQDIDFNNLGLHWTSDEKVLIKTSGTLSGNDKTGAKAFNLYVEIDETMINKEATEESNTNHAWEKEIVLNPNVVLENVIVFDMEEGEDVAEIEIANAGTNCDEWVKPFFPTYH